jgi:biotin carboxyl carrier protein
MNGRATRYVATVRGQKAGPQHTLEVQAQDARKYTVTLNGKRHELEAVVLPHGAVSLLVDGHSYAVEFEDAGEDVAVQVKGQVTRIDVADERKLRLRAATAGFVVEGKQVITAPMPGKLIKIFVKVGDTVTEGQGLLVVEAMKMENELKASKAGKVTEVVCIEGTTVENNAKLIVIE